MDEIIISGNQDIRIICKENSSFTLNFLILDSAKLNLELILEGENSEINVKGAYLLKENSEVVITTLQRHKVQNTTSNLDIRGLLTYNAKSQYNGKILIEHGANFSNASQLNKNILLSEDAHAVSIPSLEVLTNDVKCSHGSASGPLDREQLLYLMSRGFNEDFAKRELIKASFAELNLGQLQSEVNKFINQNSY